VVAIVTGGNADAERLLSAIAHSESAGLQA